jgi:hypothetical protein
MPIKTEEIDGAPPKLKLNVAARRRKNRDVGIRHASAGLWMLPASSQKIPLIVAFNRREEDIADAERVAIIADYKLKHEGREPVQIGATRDPAKVRALCKVFPDAVWGVAVGACGLVTLDLDHKHGAIEKMVPHLKAIGALNVPVPTTHTGSGGLHFTYADPFGEFDNTAGELADYGTDVRGGAGGRGGFIVAAGSVFENGTQYVSVVDLPTMYAAGTIPEMPEAVAKMIRNVAARKGEQSAEVETAQRIDVSSTEGLIRQAVIAGAMPDAGALLDPAFGFDLETLATKYPRVAEIVGGKGQTRSDDRFNIVAALKSEGASKLEVASIIMAGEFDDHVGSYVGNEVREGRNGKVLIEGKLGGEGGTFNLRNIAREYERAPTYADSSKHFGVADDDEQTPEKEATKRKGLTLLSIDEIDAIPFDPNAYLIPNLIKKGNTGFVFGEPGGGKTAIMLDLACRLSAGIKWHRKTLKRTGVLYVAAENPDDVYTRMKAWRSWMRDKGNDVGEMAFAVTPDIIDLSDPKSVKAIIKAAKQMSDKCGVACGMIVVDTFNQSIGLGNENETADMTRVTNNMNLIARETGATLIAVHHTGKNKSLGMRGSIVLKANTDFSICVADKQFRFDPASGSKLRTAAAGAPLKFKLHTIKIGENEDGESITTVVGEPDDAKKDATTAMGEVDDEAPLIPTADDMADRVTALVEMVRKSAPNYKAESESIFVAGVPITGVVKAWNADRSGRHDMDRNTLRPLDRTQVVRAAKLAASMGALTEKNGRLYLVDGGAAAKAASG